MSLFAPVFFAIFGAALGLFLATLLGFALWVLFLSIKGALIDAE